MATLTDGDKAKLRECEQSNRVRLGLPPDRGEDVIRREKSLTENEFIAQVIDYARLLGWRVAHFRPAMTKDGRWVTAVQGDGKGFPDLIMVRWSTRHRLVAELKVGRNKVTAEQDEWLTACEWCGIPAFTWYPEDWAEVEETLRDGPKATKEA